MDKLLDKQMGYPLAKYQDTFNFGMKYFEMLIRIFPIIKSWKKWFYEKVPLSIGVPTPITRGGSLLIGTYPY